MKERDRNKKKIDKRAIWMVNLLKPINASMTELLLIVFRKFTTQHK